MRRKCGEKSELSSGPFIARVRTDITLGTYCKTARHTIARGSSVQVNRLVGQSRTHIVSSMIELDIVEPAAVHRALVECEPPAARRERARLWALWWRA
jgi:hypothetical protein